MNVVVMNDNGADDYCVDGDDDSDKQEQPNVGHNQQHVEGQMSWHVHPLFNDQWDFYRLNEKISVNMCQVELQLNFESLYVAVH